MPERHKRYFLKDRESKDLLCKASKRLKTDVGQLFNTEVNVEVIETEIAEVFLANGKPVLIRTGETIFPTLVFNEYFLVAPKVVVDMGAVPFVCKGANIMAPGARRFDGQFEKGDLVLITDEKYGKPIAVAEITYNTEEAKKATRGVVAKNVHFVGDRIWNMIKEFAVSGY